MRAGVQCSPILLFRRIMRIMVARWMLALICVSTFASTATQAQLNVPFPNVTACNGANVARAEQLGLIKAVPAKAGEMGFLAGGPVEDLQGNVIEAWCLKKNDKHGGPDLAYLYTPQGKKGVWVGACTLPTGQNLMTIKTDKLLPGANGVPTFNKFTGFTWKNYANDDGMDTVKKDYEYDYDAVKDKLTISRTEGKYVDKKNPNNKTARVFDWKVVETQKDGPIAAPEKFEDLKLNGMQIALGDADNQLSKEGVALARNETADKERFELTLTTYFLSGTGTDEDPFSGLAIQILGGDTLTIAGTHIHDALVSGDAATSVFGTWAVDGIFDDHIVFRATIDALLDPGTVFGGFRFYADANNYIPWFYSGQAELSSSIGFLVPSCDVNADGKVDINDINAIFAARNSPATPGDPRDIDGDGIITVNDARICVNRCTNAHCAP